MLLLACYLSALITHARLALTGDAITFGSTNITCDQDQLLVDGISVRDLAAQLAALKVTVASQSNHLRELEELVHTQKWRLEELNNSAPQRYELPAARSPVITYLESGSGVFQLLPETRYLRVRLLGGGGAGGPAGYCGSASRGGDSVFGELVAGGGGAGEGWVEKCSGCGPRTVDDCRVGSGGQVVAGLLAFPGIAVPGASAPAEICLIQSLRHGPGAGTRFGVGGYCYDAYDSSCDSRAANLTGAGGGGASGYDSFLSKYFYGSGGGAGGFLDVLILQPARNYTYVVGAGGGVSGPPRSSIACYHKPGAGGSGFIEVSQLF